MLMVLLLVVLWFFFFQAEDGIRDLVRSRGLGDVYKRQGICSGCDLLHFSRHQIEMSRAQELEAYGLPVHQPVSYTHLTLPTSDLV